MINETKFEEWFSSLTSEQQQLVAETAYAKVKDTAEYQELTERNRELLRSTKAHESFREDNYPKYQTQRDLKTWIDPVETEKAEKQQTEELLKTFSAGTQTGRFDSSKPNYSTMPKPTIDMDKLEQSVRLFFEGIGDDPNRDGIKDTPKRVAKVWAETMNGYTLKPEDFVTLFDNDAGYGGPVVVKNLEFYTKCEHHLEPFSGTLDLAYMPGDKIIGLSKLLRIARVYCKRPQNQERLTMQIGDALWMQLRPLGVAVRIKAEHYCMISRGVRVKGAYTLTQETWGNGELEWFNE